MKPLGKRRVIGRSRVNTCGFGCLEQRVDAHTASFCRAVDVFYFETRSLLTFARSYPRSFTFYVANPIRSIETHSLPTRSRSYPRSFTFYVANPIRSILLPTSYFSSSLTSKMISNSTGVPSGRLATPYTRRQGLLSFPKTACSNSEAASATFG